MSSQQFSSDSSPPASDTANTPAAAPAEITNGTAAAGLAGDATIAEVFQAIETLIAFGFPPDVAQDAVDAVGTDPVKGYNYILDNKLATDSGGCVLPISNCPHVEDHVVLQPQDLPPRHSWSVCTHRPLNEIKTGNAKEVTNDDGVCSSHENWICLHCGVVRCSRYVNGHAVQHYEDDGHCVALSLADLSVWCYACQSYLRDFDKVDQLVKNLEGMKFGTEGETKD